MKCVRIPQGTILGPLLFILYINDIFNIMNDDSLIFSYANDTVLICCDVSWSAVHKKLQELMAKIKLWLDKNVLSLNIGKTNCITFGNYVDSIAVTFKLKLEGSIITRVDHVKYLEILIDQHLKWILKLTKKQKI